MIKTVVVRWSFSPGARSAASIILRGANDFMVDEMERSVHDALCVVKRVLESNLVVPGGGAVETALSIFLENFATSIVSVLDGSSTTYVVLLLQTYHCFKSPFSKDCLCWHYCKTTIVYFLPLCAFRYTH